MRKVEDFAKYKALFLPVIFITGILFSGLFFLRPKIFEIFEIQKKIVKERKTLADLTKKATTLEGLDEAELTEKTEVLLKALPPEKNVANILLAFKVLGSQAGISLQEVQIDSEDTIFLKIQGPLENIISFMEKIETSYPLMRIEEVAVSSKEEGPTQAAIKVKFFFLSLPQTLGPVEVPLSLITPQEEKIYQEISKFTPVLTEENLPPVGGGKENPFAF